MSRFIKIVCLILCLIILFSGCKYQIYENKTNMFVDVEKIKSIRELENSVETKTEFLKLFEEYAGFSLPENFFLPEETELSETDASAFSNVMRVKNVFFVEKSEALIMKNHIINNDKWVGYRNDDVVTGKNKSKCTFFMASDQDKHNHKGNIVWLNFHYNKEEDNYIIRLFALLQKELSLDDDLGNKDNTIINSKE